MGSATVLLKEAFAGAFTAGADVKLTLVGVPDKASLTVSHAGHYGSHWQRQRRGSDPR